MTCAHQQTELVELSSGESVGQVCRVCEPERGSVPRMEITEFLLARIAEDEAEAQRIASFEDVWIVTRMDNFVADYDPARVLAECAAKRAIVEALADGEACAQAAWRDYSRWVEGKSVGPGVVAPSREMLAGLSIAVRTLAAVYADHADFDPAWQPETVGRQ